MKMNKTKLWVSGLASSLVLCLIVGFSTNHADSEDTFEHEIYSRTFHLLENGLIDNEYDALNFVPDLSVECSLSDNYDTSEDLHPEEYYELVNWYFAECDDIYEITNAPRNISCYFRKEDDQTILEVAGYYTNDLGEQVEYYKSTTFDWVFDSGYEFYPPLTSEGTVIPENFDEYYDSLSE